MPIGLTVLAVMSLAIYDCTVNAETPGPERELFYFFLLKTIIFFCKYVYEYVNDVT